MREAGAVYIRHQARRRFALVADRSGGCETRKQRAGDDLRVLHGHQLVLFGRTFRLAAPGFGLVGVSVAISTGHMAQSSLVNQYEDRVQECTRQKDDPES